MKLTRRIELTARLTTTTGLHIGGGRGGLTTTDDTVLRGADDRPFIPGSSFKGALRATAEKLADAAGLWTCQLIGTADDDVAGIDWERDQRQTGGPKACIGPQGKAYEEFRDWAKDRELRDHALVPYLARHLCDTCHLFGSPWAGSKVRIDDLGLSYPTAPVVSVRDGVGIDRDAERAARQIKYDFEVLAAGTSFDLRLVVDEPSTPELGLLAAALLEFKDGFAGLGGKRSRGLGRCSLENLTVREWDLRSAAGLAAYLRREPTTLAQDGEAVAWLQSCIGELCGGVA